ncbi:peptidoglycan bridge formation glycyltransferase FemA/FemB family protein, partial [Patescibacteria group bacterium]|nr:peptidoglycan bridge formation glycyltransferase FemA/FemB family protein [Patescibacteria group bacterium]
MIKEISRESDWNKFVLAQQPNTFLHSWEWGEVQQHDGHDIRYLGIFDGQQQTGAALVITLKARRGRHYLIPHGPIVVHPAQSFDQLSELVQYLRTTAKQDRVVALRIAPLLLSNAKNQSYFDRLGFRQAPLHVHAELTWVRDISGSEADLLADLRKTTRHAITKAQRAGVTTHVLTSNAALDRFMPLYNATGQRHQFTTYSIEVADLLHKYYERYRVIGEKEDI